MKLSIIIPTLNEAAGIGDVLKQLQPMRARGVEVIVVDAGSRDATCDIASRWADRVLLAERGRAKQLNAGAAIADGDALLFLHADSVLPEDGDAWIEKGLNDACFQWGRFDVNIAGAHAMLPVIAWFMNYRSRLTGIATGDQGIFVTRAAFVALGGFPDQPLMEDIAFCSRALDISPPYRVSACILTSGRRWEQNGVWRTIFLMWRLRFKYFMGAEPLKLHQAYYGDQLDK